MCILFSTYDFSIVLYDFRCPGVKSYNTEKHVEIWREILSHEFRYWITYFTGDSSDFPFKAQQQMPEEYAAKVRATFHDKLEREDWPDYKAFLRTATADGVINGHQWRLWSQTVSPFSAGNVLEAWNVPRDMSASTKAGYDAPFPSEEYVTGARRFPMLVPMSPDDPSVAFISAARENLKLFDKPFLTTFAPEDPLLGWAARWYQENVPGAAGMPHQTIDNAGHFLQEDQGEQLVEIMIKFIATY